MTESRAYLVAPVVVLSLGFHCAHAQKIILDTNKKYASKWTVSEVSGGHVDTQPATFSGISNKVGTIVFQFTDNDGFWYADNMFNLPAGATSIKLKITGLVADDRVVAELNGNIISNTGIGAPGNGYMTLVDMGANEQYAFTHAYGAQKTTIKEGFLTGMNDLRLIVNNTNQGIQGGLVPGTNASTFTGISAVVTFTPAAPK